jgi:hypothetical protein
MKRKPRAAVAEPREIEKSEADWREELTPQQYDILRRAGSRAGVRRRVRFQQDRRHLPLRGLRHRPPTGTW